MEVGCQHPSTGARTGTGIELRIVEDEAAFADLRPHWDALLACQSESFFEQTFSNALAWWETTARPAGQKLLVVVGEADRQIVLLFPLVTYRHGPIRVARLLGPPLDNGDMLVARAKGYEQWVGAAWKIAASRCDLIRLPAISAQSNLSPCVRSARYADRPTGKILSIDCRRFPSWETYYDSFSKSFRNDHKKSVSRLEKAGRVRTLLVDREDQIGDSVDWTFQCKSAALITAGLNARRFLEQRAYYRRICKEALRTGALVLLELWVDGTRVAAQIAFRRDDRLEAKITTFDAEWRRCGPGRMLAVELVRWAFNEHVHLIDLGSGEHEYKYRLANCARDVTRYVLVGTSLMGRVIIALLLARRSANGLVRRSSLPEPTSGQP